VSYTLREGTAACPASKAEIVGVQKYNPPEVQPQTVALQPDALFQLKEGSLDTATISVGALREVEPTEEGFCHVDDVTVGQKEDGPNGEPIRYEWRDVRFAVSASVPGTQWSATVNYSDGACVGTYDAVGVFPAISCAVLDEDDAPIRNPDGTLQVDPRLCAQADPILLYALDPSFPVRCDNRSGLCLLDGQPPAERP
jgi:hypothetical protein